MNCEEPGGNRALMADVSRPSDCKVSCTEAGVIVPVELGSSTEKDSRSECNSGAGSRVRGSEWLRIVLPANG